MTSGATIAPQVKVTEEAMGQRTGASIVSGNKRGPGAKGALARIMLATAFILDV